MAQDFAPLAQPHLWPLVPPGESLRGVVAATQSKTFSGSLYAIGITERRLILQPFDRQIQPKGAASVVSDRSALAAADLDGAGNGWLTAPSIILSAAAVAVRVRADNGEKFTLMMMHGGSTLTGGESQQTGVRALVDLLAAARSEPGAPPGSAIVESMLRRRAWSR